MIKLLVVDDHVLFREGLASLFKAQPDFTVVGEAGDVREAINLAKQLQPDVILMDFSLPDGTGLEATQAILADHPSTQIVFLTMHEEDERLFSAIRSGAKGYLLKNLPVSRLIESLRGLQRGEALLSRSMTMKVIEEFARTDPGGVKDSKVFDQLTSREMEVLREVITGATNREIAHRLFISENTVKNHVHSILEKLRLNNRREAIRFAKKHGLDSL